MTPGQTATTPTAPGADQGRSARQVPQDRAERQRLQAAARAYVRHHGLTPPLPLEPLRRHAEELLARAGAAPEFLDYLTILVSNETWLDAMAAVPFSRRLLFLPQCLRRGRDAPSPASCQAKVDELGLLCANCGACSIGPLQAEAESLGYVVLVAEGTTVVTSLVRTGRIEAVVGVGCLDVLERIFPHMLAYAVPGIAIPLLRDGCADTAVDLEDIRKAMHLTRPGPARRIDLPDLRSTVAGWFEPQALEGTLGPPSGRTDDIARRWLARAGKRWRPLLAACAFQALREDGSRELPGSLRQIAAAVECFHKASLIHDDIEDGDKARYGRPALHEEHGLPVALNVGDFLIGEGYRLIGSCGQNPARIAAMLRVAAAGHRELCRGQGEELCWARRPRVLSGEEVVEIYRRKTSPSFGVALRLGAILAGADDRTQHVLDRYSDALGVAYQIRDDVQDAVGPGGDLRAFRPGLPAALAVHRAVGEDRELLMRLWRREDLSPADADRVEQAVERLGARREAAEMLQTFKDRAVQALEDLSAADLKIILRRVAAAIFD